MRKNFELVSELDQVARLESEAKELRRKASEKRAQADENLRHCLERLSQHIASNKTKSSDKVKS